MIDGVGAGILVQGGAAGLLLVMTSVLIKMALGLYRKIDSGELVPKATFDTLREQYADRLREARADRDAWRTAAETSAKQVDVLMEYAETTDAFIRSLRVSREST